MTREEAEEYAKEMTYRDAVYNALQGKCIPYRKAALIKLYELLDMFELQKRSDKEMDELDFKQPKKIVGKLISVEVLDKIRAEIKEMTPTYHNPDWSITDLVPISEVLKLVDKYKAESEDKG